MQPQWRISTQKLAAVLRTQSKVWLGGGCLGIGFGPCRSSPTWAGFAGLASGFGMRCQLVSYQLPVGKCGFYIKDMLKEGCVREACWH